MAEALDKIVDHPDDPPSLYIDLEGVKLLRDGTISTMQLFVAPLGTTYLIDIYSMQSTAFTTRGRKSNRSLQDVLESGATTKVFFDVRNDSGALFSHYSIRLRGVADLQLMELAARSYGSRRFVNGLAKCIERDLGLSPAEKRAWAEGKERGLALFHPDRGGDYEVFNQRPLAQELKGYCVADVRFLPRLWAVYDIKIAARWRPRLRSATESRVRRVRESQSATYNPHGPERARAPSTLEYH
ncbi:uncharacterized protein PG986_012873 [Apiospora aurea]|uniref:3'-5' exonuclease domain-containing protein n=1 Tax=Apiospora aurea TaxID=335848 RepID=A0ABR1Q1F8_9PEZI